ncbi:MAG: glucokinase, partial [Alphaproteobacteria bacterium]|nr:glucokinase [Alphaproteobacteria bacterium]
PQTDTYRNGQSLIVGIGTGFNVCPVKVELGRRPSCLAAELGHAGLPLSLIALLEERFPGEARSFRTVEDCFSGNGLSTIFSLLGGSPALSGAEIVAQHIAGNDPAATGTLELFAALLGGLCKEMALQYLPLNGIYFAGSVARGLFQSGLSPVFLNAFANHRQFQEQLSNTPVALILDDAAALLGCVNACKSR